jgi:hypothetical protein
MNRDVGLMTRQPLLPLILNGTPHIFTKHGYSPHVAGFPGQSLNTRHKFFDFPKIWQTKYAITMSQVAPPALSAKFGNRKRKKNYIRLTPGEDL